MVKIYINCFIILEIIINIFFFYISVLLYDSSVGIFQNGIYIVIDTFSLMLYQLKILIKKKKNEYKKLKLKNGVGWSSLMVPITFWKSRHFFLCPFIFYIFLNINIIVVFFFFIIFIFISRGTLLLIVSA